MFEQIKRTDGAATVRKLNAFLAAGLDEPLDDRNEKRSASTGRLDDQLPR